jgi:hypothetical protein
MNTLLSIYTFQQYEIYPFSCSGMLQSELDALYNPSHSVATSVVDNLLRVKNRTTASGFIQAEDSQVRDFKLPRYSRRIGTFDGGFSNTGNKHGPIAVYYTDRILAAGTE